MSTHEPGADTPDPLAFLPSKPPLVSDETIALRNDAQLFDRRTDSNSGSWRVRAFERIRAVTELVADSDVLKTTYEFTHSRGVGATTARSKFSLDDLTAVEEVTDGDSAVQLNDASKGIRPHATEADHANDDESKANDSRKIDAVEDKSNVHYVKPKFKAPTGFEYTSIRTLIPQHHVHQRDKE